MKVLLVSIGKMAGGIENYTITLGKLLVQNGIEVHYALRTESWLNENIQTDKKIMVSLGKKTFIDMKRINRYVKDENIDIVHCNSNNGLFVSLLVKENSSCKKIGVIHGDVMVDQAYKGKIVSWCYAKLETWLLNYTCCRCVAVSESMKEIIVNRGVSEKKVELVYNGIETYKYENFPDYFFNTLWICSVGNLLPSKNHIKLLEAMKKIKERCPEVKLKCDIYGEGIERKNLEQYIELNKLNNVALKGYDIHVREKLAGYPLYVHPSRYESFGISVLEAMDAGCCVIGNQVGGLKEILTDEVGYLIDCNDTDKLAETILMVYMNRKELAKKGKAGKEMCKNKFSTWNMTMKMMNLYNRIWGAAS